MARITAYLTATAVTPADNGDHRDEHGYIDPEWSRTQLHDKREDVTPVIDVDESGEDLASEVREAIEGMGISADNGDGSFIGQDEYVEDGKSYTYVLHFDRDGAPWHPAKDGGVDLSGIRFA